MKCIALIPARGGSKRLPRKNIMDFLGKPILAYTIEAAQKSNLFDRIVVSTEDKEISNITQLFGAEVDNRSAELATDQASVTDVCLDFLHRYTEIQTFAVLYATAPLRTAADIQSVVGLLGNAADFAMAVTPCSWPSHQMLRWRENELLPLFPELVNLKTSEAETFYIDNGSTYAVHVPAFLQQKTFYGKNLRAHCMPAERSVDIDTPADLAMALYYAGEGGLRSAVGAKQTGVRV